MEKKQVREAHRLLVIMVFFVASILLLNSQKRRSATETHIDSSNATMESIINLSVEQAYHHMNSLFVSHNIDLVIKVINQCMHQFTVELVEKIVSDNTYLLSSEEKMEIIFGTATYCSAKKNMCYQLLNLLIKYPALYERQPALLVLMYSPYAESLSAFINWGKDYQKTTEQKNVLSNFIEHAFNTAIEQNDYNVIETMFNKKVRISQEKASEFLWIVVEQNKDSDFVPMLVKYGHADVNCMKEGKTLLIAAVEQDNKPMVQALLDAGAVVDRIADPCKGTALQIAMSHKYNATASLLREYGG